MVLTLHEVDPSILLVVPAGHFSHVARPFLLLNVPGRHCQHTATSSSDKKPADPAGQLVHSSSFQSDVAGNNAPQHAVRLAALTTTSLNLEDTSSR